MREQSDFNPDDFESREAADKSVYVKFHIRPVRDDTESDKAGRPVYVDKEYVEIRTPGQQNNIINRPVTDMDRQRFRQQYRAFKDGMEEQTVGTPLSEVAWLTRSQVEEMAFLRIRTVEHLANLGDDICGKHVGFYKLKQKAQQIVAEGEKNAPFAQLQAKAEEQANELAAMRQTIAEQSEIIRKMQADATAKK